MESSYNIIDAKCHKIFMIYHMNNLFIYINTQNRSLRLERYA